MPILSLLLAAGLLVSQAPTTPPAPKASAAPASEAVGDNEAGKAVEESPDKAPANAPAEAKESAPAAPPAPAPAKTAEQSRALLEAALANLRALFVGNWPEETPVQTGFAVNLDDLEAVATRMQELGNEVTVIEQRRASLEQRLAKLEVELPPAQKSELLATPAPELPEGVTQEMLDNPVDKRGRPKRLPSSARKAIAEFKEALRLRAEAEATYAAAVVERAELLSKLGLEIKSELDSLAVRGELAKLRRDYLTAWVHTAEKISNPARATLVTFNQPRTAVRAQAEAVERVVAALVAADARLGQLRAAAGAGGLLGFRAQQEALIADLDATRAALDERRLVLAERAVELGAAAAALEQRGRQLRLVFLTSVVGPDGPARLDQQFLEHLRELRLLRRATAKNAVDPRKRAEDLVRQLNELLPDPAAVGSVSAANEVVAAANNLVEEAQRLSDSGTIAIAQWQLAFAREAVTLFEGVASEATRDSAFAFSAEMFADLRADLLQVGEGLLAWAEKRRQAAAGLHFSNKSDWPERRLLGWGFALAVLVAWTLLRKRTPRLVAGSVRLVVRLPALRRHVGTVVRWSSLANAAVPTLIGGAAAYAAMGAIGFDLEEVQLFEVCFRWVFLYLLGKRALVGLTRRISPGRPALIDASADTVTKLSLTYDRAGLVLALGALIDELSVVFLGSGLLQSLVHWVVYIWISGWSLWAAFYWRQTLAALWRRQLEESSREQGIVAWMARHTAGALLAPVALLRLLGAVLWRIGEKLASKQGLAAYLKARALRRMSSKDGGDDEEKDLDELPEPYTKEFPLYPMLGEEDAVVLPRQEQYQELDDQLERWKEKRTDSSVVVIGEKGMGKTTLLAMLSRRCTDLEVNHVTLVDRLVSRSFLARTFSRELGVPSTDSVDELAKALLAGPDRMVLVDDAQNVYLRVVDGYQGFDALVQLVNATSDKVFWVLVFNSFAWDFINASRGRVHYFRRLFWVPKWTTAELRDLIGQRNQRTGYKIVFDEQLLDEERADATSFRLIEGADGYFRLLWEASGGNARLATHLWLQSLTTSTSKTVHVGLFKQVSNQALENAGDDVLFSLAAICQHENLTVDELQQVLNVGPGFAHFAVRYLREYGFVEPKETAPDRLTLSPRRYLQVIRALRAKHLVYTEE